MAGRRFFIARSSANTLPANFAVQLRCAKFHAGVPDPKNFNMPMELRFEFVTIVRPHLANAEREFFGVWLDIGFEAPLF
jgi:hypothetical protein